MSLFTRTEDIEVSGIQFRRISSFSNWRFMIAAHKEQSRRSHQVSKSTKWKQKFWLLVYVFNLEYLLAVLSQQPSGILHVILFFY